MFGIILCVHRPFCDESQLSCQVCIDIARSLRLSSCVVDSISFAMNRRFASPAAMFTGNMPAMTFAASPDTVLKALMTLMAVSLCIDCIFLLFSCSLSASAQICAPYTSDDVMTLARSIRLLLLGPPVFASILASALYVFDAFSHACFVCALKLSPATRPSTLFRPWIQRLGFPPSPSPSPSLYVC